MSDNKNVLDIDVNMTFKDILFQIRLKGYGYIGFDYSGGGDSGSIDDIYLIPKDAAEQDEHGTIRISDYDIVSNVKDGISKELHQLISRDFLRRQMPWEINVTMEEQKIEIEKLRDSLVAAISGYAQAIPSLATQGQE